MRFSATHKLTSYLMVTTATIALLLAPDISALAAWTALVALAASWFADPPRLSGKWTARLWNVATILFVGWLVVDVLLGESVITAGVHFLLFILINKMFNRATSKDYRQAYAVSFLMLVAATTLNTGISYAICFVLYVVFAVWSLILFHLRREMEDNYLLKHGVGGQSEKVQIARILNSRRVIGGRFLAGTSLLSLGVLVGAGVVFLIFPRIGFGLFAGHRPSNVTMAGFSDRIRLGHHGTIRDNPQVVMRVVVPAAQRGRRLLWRGSAFDHYKKGTWSHGPDLIGRRQLVHPTGGLYQLNHAPGIPVRASARFVRERLFRQEIYLEPFGSKQLFAADRPVAIAVPKRRVDRRRPFVPLRGPLGEIHARKRQPLAALRYVAYSQIERPSARQMQAATPIKQRPGLQRFLQLPPTFSQRIRELAARLTAGKATRYDKVQAIAHHLKRNYRYSLRLSHDKQREPVDEFLFVTRAGHCEYFASAMVLLLRASGIHARNVNGFAGGSYNSYGRYWAIRQGDAHAWVEVLFGNIGWVAFDPTPAVAMAQQDSAAWTAIAQLIDNLRMRWLRHVVDYDLGQQLSLFRSAARMLRGSKTKDRSSLRRPLALLGATLLAVGVLVWVVRRRRHAPSQRRASRSRRPHAASRIYARALRALRDAGLQKPLGETPAEFSQQLRDTEAVGNEAFDSLTRSYYQARYAAQPPNEVLLAQMQAQLSELQQQLKHME